MAFARSNSSILLTGGDVIRYNSALKVFNIICEHLDRYRVDSLLVEKCKTGTALRHEERFYPQMLGYLLKFVLEKEQAEHIDEIIVITDTIPLRKRQNTIIKTIQQVLAKMLPENCCYRILHHPSKAHFGLQIADYCNWAIFRKWEKGQDIH